MKVHTKIVIDLTTDQVLEDEFYEYEGPISSCDPVSAGIAIGGSALLGAYSANKAASAQEAAAAQAGNIAGAQLSEDTRRYNEMAPYRTAGIGAVTSLSDILSGKVDPTQALQSDPGYAFRLAQGQTALDRFLSARGNRLGGAALKAGINYNQNFATNEYQNMLNNKFRLAGFSGNVTPAPDTSNIANTALMAGQSQANYYGNLSNIGNQALNNYATYRTYNNWTPQLSSPGANINTWTPSPVNLGGPNYGG